MGRFEIRVCEGSGLEKDFLGNARETYPMVSCAGQNAKGPRSAGFNPRWEFLSSFSVKDPESTVVEVQIWEENTFRSDTLYATIAIPLAGLTQGIVTDKWYRFMNGKGQLRVRLVAQDFGAPPPAAPAMPMMMYPHAAYGGVMPVNYGAHFGVHYPHPGAVPYVGTAPVMPMVQGLSVAPGHYAAHTAYAIPGAPMEQPRAPPQEKTI